jgi:hypothetical protein
MFHYQSAFEVFKNYIKYKILHESSFYDYYIFTGQDIIPLIPLEC